MKTDADRQNGLFLSTDPGMNKLERLMPFQIKRILLVASLYDCFVLEEDGRLKELLTHSYHQWNLDYVPHLVRIVGNQMALQRIQAEKFDLVISMVRPGERAPFALGREMKRITERLVKKDKVPEGLPLEKGNSLLASMGALGRDFFGLIHGLGCEEHHSFVDPGEKSLLHCIHQEGRNNLKTTYIYSLYTGHGFHHRLSTVLHVL